MSLQSGEVWPSGNSTRRADIAIVSSSTSTTRYSTTCTELVMIDDAWRRFSQHIGELGRALPDPPFPQSERETTDGYRYLTRLMVIGLQWAIEFADPDFPAFYRHDDDVTKWGGPNVDNTYLRARVRADNAYRIVGSRGSAHGFLISECEGDMQLEQYGVYDEIWDDQLHGGTARLSCLQRARLPATTAIGYDCIPSRNITCARYFKDWSRETRRRRIERLGVRVCRHPRCNDGWHGESEKPANDRQIVPLRNRYVATRTQSCSRDSSRRVRRKVVPGHRVRRRVLPPRHRRAFVRGEPPIAGF